MPRGYGGRTVASKKEKEKTVLELIEDMHRYGDPQTLPVTMRKVRVKSADAKALLKEGNLPDILTPLVVKSIYQDLTDTELRKFLAEPRAKVEDALAMADAIDYVVEKHLVSGAKLSELTSAEKRWIFRLVMGSAESLVTFRLEEEPDVEPVPEGDEVRETT